MSIRTTITLDDDVAEGLREQSKKKGIPFRTAVNEAIRDGLRVQIDVKARKRFVVQPLDVGPLKPGYSYDSISKLLAQAEGEDYR